MDTHAVIGKLQDEYGMSSKTAEAIVYAVRNLIGLATKEDLEHLRERLESRVGRLEDKVANVIQGLADLKMSMIKWIIGLFIAMAGIQIAAIAFLISVLN